MNLLLPLFTFITMGNVSFAKRRDEKNLSERNANQQQISDFEMPLIHFKEWLINENSSWLGSRPLINYKFASHQILNFTRDAVKFFKVDISKFEISELRTYSYALNKKFYLLNEFPEFLERLLPKLSFYEDILFIENSLDIFAILETQRYLTLEKIYDHVQDMSNFVQPSSTFRSMLLGFRKHIENQTRKLRQFLRSTMEARSNNVYIPSRYTKGSLPGLDHLMSSLNVSSPLKTMNGSSFRITPRKYNSLCLVPDVELKREFLKVEQKNSANRCLDFRFENSSIENENYVIKTNKNSNKNLSLRQPPFLDIELVTNSDKKKELQQQQFRVLQLTNETSLIVQRTKDKTYFLTSAGISGKIFGKMKYYDELSEWRIVNNSEP